MTYTVGHWYKVFNDEENKAPNLMFAIINGQNVFLSDEYVYVVHGVNPQGYLMLKIPQRSSGTHSGYIFGNKRSIEDIVKSTSKACTQRDFGERCFLLTRDGGADSSYFPREIPYKHIDENVSLLHKRSKQKKKNRVKT